MDNVPKSMGGKQGDQRHIWVARDQIGQNSIWGDQGGERADKEPSPWVVGGL